jgi:hypothetical protein
MHPSSRGGPFTGMILVFLFLSPAASPGHDARNPSSYAATSASPLPEPGPASPAPRAASQTAAGMVLRVDPEAPRLELLTGVGLALRVLRIRCDESTVIQAAGKAVRLASLKRGDAVRVVCRPAGEGYIAIRIELLPRPATEGGRP